MKNTDKYVGLDVHKDTTVIAVAEAGRSGEVRVYGTISSDLGALEKVLRKLGGEGVTLHVVYEAGPTGYGLYRRLQQLQIACLVVAPTKTPQEKGPRQKTDRRDAEQLARLHRAGELTGIYVPDAVDESGPKKGPCCSTLPMLLSSQTREPEEGPLGPGFGEAKRGPRPLFRRFGEQRLIQRIRPAAIRRKAGFGDPALHRSGSKKGPCCSTLPFFCCLR
ncbi:MAG: transposase [Opitutaceae bacterium]